MMVNKQLTPAAKVKRMARELGAQVTDDPEGVMAVLQTGRRLLAEGGELLKDGWQEKQSRGRHTKFSVTGALREALDLAHPKDRHKALIWAQHALQGALNRDVKRDCGMAHLPDPILSTFEQHPDTDILDALRIYDAAIKSQGAVNFSDKKVRGYR